jgi:hypothetical protein
MNRLDDNAVHRLGRDQWWESVRSSLDQMTPDEAADYRAEAAQLDGIAADGLRAG